MSCERYEALLHGYADGELDAANVIEVDEHLSGCRACHESLSELQFVRVSLAAAHLGYRAPERVRASIARTVRPRFGLRSAGRWAAPAFSGALAASFALVLALPVRTAVPVEHEIVESHVRSMLADHLIDVASTSEHVVRPWFNGRIDFAPRVPNLGPDGFTLIGGRLDYVGDRVVAAMVYRAGRHAINVYAWPGPPSAAMSGSTQGYALVEWSEGTLRYTAISDAGPGEMRRFRSVFLASARRSGEQSL
jgi:anti-sigma factor RsiW